MDLRELQRPLKQQYRAEPARAVITLRASASQEGSPMACSVDVGRALYAAQAHTGVGGPGTAACSGDLLLGALAACAQVTYQMVATACGARSASHLTRRWASAPSASTSQSRPPRPPPSSWPQCGRRPSATASSSRP